MGGGKVIQRAKIYSDYFLVGHLARIYFSVCGLFLAEEVMF
jgi:hypothetical protein